MRLISNIVRVRHLLNIVIISVFLLHGILYFFNPQDIYDSNSPIKVIKYILLVLFLIINLDRISISNFIIYLIVSLISLFLLYVSNQRLQYNYVELLSKFLPYNAPLLIILFYKAFRKIPWIKIVWVTYVFASIAGFVEFFIFRGVFAQFSYNDNSLRIASIFINPNNAGLMIALLNYFIISHLKINGIKGYFLSVIIGFNSLVLIILTGSKTGLFVISLQYTLLFGVHLIRIVNVKAINKAFLNFFLTCLTGIIFFTIFLLFYHQKSENDSVASTRELSLETGNIRLEQIMDFGGDLKRNFVAPFYSKSNFVLDNAYLQFWGDFGLLGFLGLILLITFVSFKLIGANSKLQFPFFVIVLIGFSLNIFYIWPGSYLFCAYITIVMSKKELRYYGSS